MEENTQFNPYKYTGSKNVEIVYGYVGIAFGIMFFGGINYFLIKRGPPSNFTSSERRWRNTCVSMVHAIISGSCAMYSILFKHEMYTEPMFYCDYFIYLLVAFSTGYFVYDILDYVVNKKLISHGKEMLTHHVVVISVTLYIIQNRIYVVYTIIGLLAEVNSVFLHWRRISYFHKWPLDYWLYRPIIVLNYITFVLVRMGSVLVLLYLLIEHWNIYPTTFKFVLVIMAAPAFLCINPILLWRIAKGDMSRHASVEQKQKGVVALVNGNSDMSRHGSVEQKQNGVALVNGNNNIKKHR